MTDQTKWKRRDDWVGTEVEGQLVMINVDSGRYVSLNASAAEAWRLLEQPLDRNQMVDGMTATFAVDRGTCERSVTDLIDRMRSLDLIDAAA